MLRARFLDQMERYPILLCPVFAVPAFRHGERSWTVEGQKVEYLDASSYSQWFNLLGNPAAVVPMDRSDDGLPIGVQIVGRPWEEERVLAVAAALERGRWMDSAAENYLPDPECQNATSADHYFGFRGLDRGLSLRLPSATIPYLAIVLAHVAAGCCSRLF